MPELALTRYARHSRWSDPGVFATRLDPLPSDAAALAEIVGAITKFFGRDESLGRA